MKSFYRTVTVTGGARTGAFPIFGSATLGSCTVVSTRVSLLLNNGSTVCSTFNDSADAAVGASAGVSIAV